MKRREKGFTLLEVLIGVAIMAIVVGAVAMTITTLLLNEGQAAGQNTALPQVQNAGYWISRDVQMARIVTLDEPGVFLRLDIPMDNNPDNDYTIDYVFDGDKLKRQVYDSLGTPTSETFIAEYIDTGITTFSVLDADAGLWKLTVRASRDETGATRSYEISQRLSPAS
jgi:prepilin-type N-terminal cleavage/methylation domain-containing protein